MQKYKCHKIVEASKIVQIDNDVPSEFFLVFDGQVGVDVHHSWIDKHNPEVGGYFVKHSDGYTSYSPAEPFESGYSPIKDGNGFGWALEEILAGKNMQRVGWGSEHIFVCFIPAGNAAFKSLNMQDCFGIKDVCGEIQPGWTPTTRDMLANDWQWA